MNNDRRSNPGRADDESFSGALDDLFGPQEPQPVDDPPAAEPVQQLPPEPPPAPATAAEPEPVPAPSPPSYPVQDAAAPAPRQRTFKEIAGLGCAFALVLLATCFVILAVIGMLADGSA